MPALFKNSISYHFILRILPAFFFISLTFLVILSIIQVNNAKHASRKAAQDQADNLAILLQESVWQLSTTLSESILISVLDDNIICAELKQNTSMDPVDLLLVKGDCKNINDSSEETIEAFNSAIIYHDLGQPRKLGDARIYIRMQTDWDAISKEIAILVILTLVLFFTIVAVTVVVFRWAILTPLANVSKSLKTYQETGVRTPVNWHTEDELGIFIHEYNNGLIRQNETETELEATRHEAEQALASLREAQQRLIQAEKMASLGELVAGVAHEINTPLGISITVASTVVDLSKELEVKLDNQTLSKKNLHRYISSLHEASSIIEKSLKIAAGLVSNFKQIAVDQTSEQRRVFDLKDTVEEILFTLRPLFKSTGFTSQVSVPEGLMMDSYPGPLGQVITNCFNNAIIHGFEACAEGHISFTVLSIDEDWVALEISDNGKGMSQEAVHKAFDPFFTTKRGKGGTGLGLNIVFNIVTTILGGSINIYSVEGEGTNIYLRLPVKVSDENESVVGSR